MTELNVNDRSNYNKFFKFINKNKNIANKDSLTDHNPSL